MRATVFVLALFTLTLSACDIPQVEVAASAMSPIPTVILASPDAQHTPEIALSATPEAETATPPPLKNDVLRTQYDIQVLYTHPGTLEIEQEITYLNTSASMLDELVLVLYARPELYAWQSVLNGAPSYTPAEYHIVDGLLQIPLEKTLMPGARVTFTLYYTLSLPPVGMLGYNERSTHLAYWYAFVPPYDDTSGWLVHSPGKVGEHQPMDVADYEVTIRPTDPMLVIAATGYEQILDTGFHYSLENARHFMWTASYQLAMLEQDYEGIVIQSYYFPVHQAAAQKTLDVAVEALTLYQSLYGAYPHRSLTIIETYVNDGLEADAGFFLDAFYYGIYDGSDQNYLTTLTAHEIAHSWFFGQVGNDPALEPWLDETMGIYNELLYYETYHPELVDWWWRFRIDRYGGTSGWVNSKIYDHQTFESYVQAVYFRGAMFMRDLRVLVGDDAFFAILAEYAQLPSDKMTHADDFFNIVDSHSDVDLSDLKETYFSSWR